MNSFIIIFSIYIETKNKIATGNEEGENKCFWTGKGVKQGCPLSPTLSSMDNMIWKRKTIVGTVVGD